MKSLKELKAGGLTQLGNDQWTEQTCSCWGRGGGGEWLKEGCIGSLGLADANCYTENG